jgi:uncharacterized LabA/DUF88 family protein
VDRCCVNRKRIVSSSIIQRQRAGVPKAASGAILCGFCVSGADIGVRAVFYIDGFNFYYLRTKKQPHFKWLNLKQLADCIVPTGTTVLSVNYYTASVSGKIDADAPRRQQALFSALATVPEVRIFKGRFLYSEKWAGLVKPAQAMPHGYAWNQPEPDVVKIKKSEEKGSDVNLGVHLVRDAFINAFDVAYVLTNDTDLVEPVRIVTQEVCKKVCIVAPCRPFVERGRTIPVPAPSLSAVSSFIHFIDDAELRVSQFPQHINRAGKKPVSRPLTWV